MNSNDAQDKYIELMKYLMDNYPNVEPVYESYEDFYKTNGRSHQENYNKFDRALRYFKGEEVGRGKKPELTTYIKKMSESNEEISEESNNDNLNSNSDFLSNKMATVNYDDIIKQFEIGEAKQSTKNSFKNSDYVTRYGNAMDNFRENFTKKNMTIGFNSNYIKPDYLKTVFEPRHPGWKIDYTDWDKDDYPDVSITDDEGRLRIFNGFYFNDDTEKDKLRKHYLANPNNTYSTYLDEKFELKNAERAKKGLDPLVRGGSKPHGKLVKNFVKWLHNIVMPVAKTLPRHDKMLFDASGFDSKLEATVERFLVLPFILHKLGFANEKIKNIVYANDKKSDLYKLRMSILRSEKIKKLYKDNADYINNSLDALMNNISKNFIIIDNGKEVINQKTVAEFITAYMKGTWDIPTMFYNYAVTA